MDAPLRLREFREDDLDALATMVGDPEQMAFYRRPKTREEASAWIRRNRALYEKHGFGFWLIDLHPLSPFAGYCGIRPLELDGVSEIEIGWHVHKRFWNRGIATEAAAIARDAAARFGIPRLVALVHPEHVASRRVAAKIGMHQERTTVLEGDYPAIVYAASSAARRPSRSSAPKTTRFRVAT